MCFFFIGTLSFRMSHRNDVAVLVLVAAEVEPPPLLFWFWRFRLGLLPLSLIGVELATGSFPSSTSR